MFFIFRVFETALFQNRIQILLPQPGTIEQNTINLVFLLSVFERFVAEDSQAKVLEVGVCRIVGMVYGAKVLVDDFHTFPHVVRLCGKSDLRDATFGFRVIVQNNGTVLFGADVFYGVADQLRNLVVITVFASGIGNSSSERNIFADMPIYVYRSPNIGIIVFKSSVFFEQSLCKCLLQEVRKQI